jgi:hypothetical protein
MAEWLHEDIRRGQIVLTIATLVITVAIVWFGRKRLKWSIPAAFAFFLVVSIQIPSAISARPTAQRNTCIANLRQIDGAKQEWAKINQKGDNAIPSAGDLYGTNQFIRHEPRCPRGETYTINAVRENTTCSLAAKGHKLE